MAIMECVVWCGVVYHSTTLNMPFIEGGRFVKVILNFLML